MELSNAHVRYLLSIYQLARAHPNVSSSEVAKLLNVKKPSVARMLEVLMSKNLIVKKPYGKIHLTKIGLATAKQYEQKIIMLSRLLRKNLVLTENEASTVASNMVSELPEHCFSLKGRNGYR